MAEISPSDLGVEARRLSILARLRRWGWPADEAELTATRIAARSADDDRHACPECAHYIPDRCRNHAAALLHGPEVGRDLAALPQRCSGFAVREEFVSQPAAAAAPFMEVF